MRSPIDNKFHKDIKALKESRDLKHHIGERFNFSAKYLSLVARHITNHILEINKKFIYANIGDVDYYLQVLRDRNTYFDALVLNSHHVYQVCDLKGQSCNLLMINRDYQDSKVLIQGHTLYKAEDTITNFFHNHLDIFMTELERATIAHMLRLGASASFLGNCIHHFNSCEYPIKLIPT